MTVVKFHRKNIDSSSVAVAGGKKKERSAHGRGGGGANRPAAKATFSPSTRSSTGRINPLVNNNERDPGEVITH